MYTLGDQDEAPVLQHSVEVTKRDPPTGWATVPSFVSGPPRRPLSKEAFYSKLGQTPDAALPKVEQMVTITSREEGARRAHGGRSRSGEGSGVVVISGGESSDSDGEVPVDVGGGGGDEHLKALTSGGGGGGGDGGGNGGGGAVVSSAVGGAAAASSGIEKETDGKIGPKSIVDVFLVCAAIGGGGAKKMACLAEHRHMKLIPWGGVSMSSAGVFLVGRRTLGGGNFPM